MYQISVLGLFRCKFFSKLTHYRNIHYCLRSCRFSTFKHTPQKFTHFMCSEHLYALPTVVSYKTKSVYHLEPVRTLSKVHGPEISLVTMKVDSPAFHALFTPELRKLINIFEKYGYELRIAGGAVRDLLMDKTSDDIDLATTATPAQMKEMFEQEGVRMLNMKGEKHGTITCRIDDKVNFEVTTLRIDMVTDGRHAEVQFTTDWQLDALRRDLTINSMFLGFDGTIYDYFNGMGDLAERRIRFVGDAASRIQEDYLRILRYFRFFGRISKYPDAHEQSTLRAIKDNMHGLEGISGERIWVELKKIVTGRYASHVVTTMMDLGIAKYIGLGDNPDTAEFKKVYERCHDLEPKPLTLIPALLKDENQLYRFHERVKLSKEEQRTGLFIIQHRDDELPPDLFRYCEDLHCDTVIKNLKAKEHIMELLKYLGKRETLECFRTWQPPKFPLKGHKLLALGVKQREMSKILDKLRVIWKESHYMMTEEELAARVEELKNEEHA